MRQVNLLPEDIRKSEEIRKVRHSLVFTIGAPLLGIVVIHLLLVLLVHHLKTAASEPLGFQDTPQISAVREKIDQIQSSAGDFSRQHQSAVKIICRLRSPVGFLLRLGEAVREKVWLTDVQLDYGKKVCELTGRSFNTRLVSEFMLELKTMNAVENFELVSMEQKESSSTPEIEFKLKIHLN